MKTSKHAKKFWELLDDGGLATTHIRIFIRMTWAMLLILYCKVYSSGWRGPFCLSCICIWMTGPCCLSCIFIRVTGALRPLSYIYLDNRSLAVSLSYIYLDDGGLAASDLYLSEWLSLSASLIYLSGWQSLSASLIYLSRWRGIAASVTYLSGWRGPGYFSLICIFAPPLPLGGWQDCVSTLMKKKRK